MSAWLYVYYRVDVTHLEPARRAVENVLAEMRSGPCSRARLLTKTDEPLLWMEAYEEVPDRAEFEQILDASVHRHGLDACLAAGERRHIEVFSLECA